MDRLVAPTARKSPEAREALTVRAPALAES